MQHLLVIVFPKYIKTEKIVFWENKEQKIKEKLFSIKLCSCLHSNKNTKQLVFIISCHLMHKGECRYWRAGKERRYGWSQGVWGQQNMELGRYYHLQVLISARQLSGRKYSIVLSDRLYPYIVKCLCVKVFDRKSRGRYLFFLPESYWSLMYQIDIEELGS